MFPKRRQRARENNPSWPGKETTVTLDLGSPRFVRTIKVMGTMLLTLGTMLFIIGQILGPIGIPIKMLGLALIAWGNLLLAKAQGMEDKAKSLGTEVQVQYGQQDQGAIVKDCAHQAHDLLIPVESCNPADKPQVGGAVLKVNAPVINVPQLVEACRSDWQKLCKNVKPGGGRIIRCMQQHESQVSSRCKANWPSDAVMSSMAQGQAPPAAPAPPAEGGPIDPSLSEDGLLP